MKTLAFKRGGPLGDRPYMVLAHTTAEPDADEWAAYVATIARVLEAQKRTVHVIVATDGGGPSASQRKELADVFARDTYGSLTHVFTTSALVRGIVTAFHWIARARAVAHPPNEFNVVCARAGILASEVVADLQVVQEQLPRIEMIRQLETVVRKPGKRDGSLPRHSQRS